MSRSTLALLFAACWLCAPSWPAAADDARAILIEAAQRHRNRSQEYTGELIVVSKNGTQRRKVSRSYREGFGDTANRLIRFLSPPEVRGVGFLSLGRAGQLPDRWMYLPSMKRERRIAAQEQGGAFVGTDFSYEDLQEFDHAKFDVLLLPSQAIEGHPCHVIQMLPRDRSTYAKKIVFLRADNLYLVRSEFFRKGDTTPSKRLDLLDYEQIDGYWAARKLVMVDLQKGSQTTVLVTDVAFDRPQPPDRFTIQNLTREGGDEPPARRPDQPRPRGAASMGASWLADWPPALAPPTWYPRGSRGGMHRAENISESRTRDTSWGVTGFAEALGVAFASTANDRDSRASVWATVFVKKQTQIGRVRLVGALRAQKISSDEQGELAFDPADRLAKRSPLSFGELSMVVRLAPAIDVQAGRFPLSWGVTDLYSPADAFLPRDISDPFSEEKLPLWGTRLQGERGPYRFEIFASWVTTPWRLPAMDGRYSPFASAGVYLVERSTTPPTRGFEAARLQRTGEHWDLGVWARTGIRPSPILVADSESEVQEQVAALSAGGAPPPGGLFVPVNRRFAREDGIGAQVSRDVNDWMLRGEVAVLRSRDPSVGNAVLWSAEAERPVRSGSMAFTMAGNAIEPPVDSLLLFDRAYLPGFIMAVTQTESWGTWRVSYLTTIKKIGGIFETQVARDLSDTVKVMLGTDLPLGTPLESPGAFFKARQVRASLRWSW